MFHKITGVTALSDFILRVQFTEGATMLYDLKPLIDAYPIFAPLRDHPELYHSVTVDTGGYGTVWNDDIACDELFDNGKPIEPHSTASSP